MLPSLFLLVTLFDVSRSQYFLQPSAGYLDGPASSALFAQPGALAMGSGNIYISEYSRIRALAMPGGSVITLAGSGGYGTANGAGTAASACAVSPASNVLALDAQSPQ